MVGEVKNYVSVEYLSENDNSNKEKVLVDIKDYEGRSVFGHVDKKFIQDSKLEVSVISRVNGTDWAFVKILNGEFNGYNEIFRIKKQDIIEKIT